VTRYKKSTLERQSLTKVKISIYILHNVPTFGVEWSCSSFTKYVLLWSAVGPSNSSYITFFFFSISTVCISIVGAKVWKKQFLYIQFNFTQHQPLTTASDRLDHSWCWGTGPVPCTSTSALDCPPSPIRSRAAQLDLYQQQSQLEHDSSSVSCNPILSCDPTCIFNYFGKNKPSDNVSLLVIIFNDCILLMQAAKLPHRNMPL